MTAPLPDLLRPPAGQPRRHRVYEVVFGHETRAGRIFDVLLIVAILASVAAIMLESVVEIRARHGPLLRGVEWFFTLLFTVEYAVRLWCVARAFRYARSFFGVIDLLAIAPTWLSLVLPGGQAFGVVRILRVLRVFRILKLAQYVGESRHLADALYASRRKIIVFLFTVATLVVVIGSAMYLIEGPEAGFTSIPAGVYWAVVTLTTVGFGDITPQTGVGQFLATLVMVMGYGIIAVPTGIVTAEMTGGWRSRQAVSGGCPRCGLAVHDLDARYCTRCGEWVGDEPGDGARGAPAP